MQELAAYSRTESLFLSVYLDWTPDGMGKRPSTQILEQKLKQIGDGLPANGPERESFDADRQRILEYIDTAPKEANSLIIFACAAENIWRVAVLQAAVETEVIADHYPHLFQLARIADDYETYAVALVDGQEAELFVVTFNDVAQVATTEADERIKRFDAGGQAQMLFQRRTDNLIKAHTKDMAAQLEQMVKRYDIRHVVISTNDSVKGVVMDSLPDSIKAMLIDTINLDKSTSNPQTIIETVEPMLVDVERQQEMADVERLEEQTYSQGLGVVGADDVAMALSKGQVDTLLILKDYSGQGSECPVCGTLFGHAQPTCPFDVAETHEVDLRAALIQRAFQQSAAVQIIDSSDYLAQHDGIGALLRYRDMEQIAVS
jgi:peptide subunit release factor 1 (eRF1)